jgi:hypothetical protein
VKKTAKIIELAEVGAGRIEAQLHRASATALDAARDLWALGYVFGIFDVLGRQQNLDQNAEGSILISVGFQRLFVDEDAGVSQLARATQSQRDLAFIEGNTRAGSEICAWLADTKKVPMGLCTRLMARDLIATRMQLSARALMDSIFSDNRIGMPVGSGGLSKSWRSP